MLAGDCSSQDWASNSERASWDARSCTRWPCLSFKRRFWLTFWSWKNRMKNRKHGSSSCPKQPFLSKAWFSPSSGFQTPSCTKQSKDTLSQAAPKKMNKTLHFKIRRASSWRVSWTWSWCTASWLASSTSQRTQKISRWTLRPPSKSPPWPSTRFASRTSSSGKTLTNTAYWWRTKMTRAKQLLMNIYASR